MNEELKSYLDSIFEDAPKTRAAFDLKEELLSNSIERYNDLICTGVSKEDAIQNVIDSIGDVSGLFTSFDDASDDNMERIDPKIIILAKYKALAIGMYIFGVGAFFLSIYIGGNLELNMPMGFSIGLIVMILIDIVPTCILVYINSAYPKYIRKDETVVEEFKEWTSEKKGLKAIRNSTLVIMWCFIFIMYFVISFVSWAWYATWILFLVGICLHAIIVLLFQLKEYRR